MYGLREMGYSLLVPFGENTRYDLVVDDGSQLWRVQCKTGDAIRLYVRNRAFTRAAPRRYARTWRSR